MNQSTPHHTPQIRFRGHSLEALEARIAPSAIVTFTDTDGDLVTVKTTKGTNAELASITTLTAAGTADVPTAKTLSKIDFHSDPSDFAGTSLTISVKPNFTPLGADHLTGDGLIQVAEINATGVNLGDIKIAGLLAKFEAGTAGTTQAVKSLNVEYLGAHFTQGTNLDINIVGPVGSLTVGNDMGENQVSISGSLGKLIVGGKLDETFLHIGGGLAMARIAGDLLGNSGSLDVNGGSIQVDGKIGTLWIGGSIVGGGATNTGEVIAHNNIGSVTVMGDLIGGTHSDTGDIYTPKSIGTVSIHGSVTGNDPFSGRILAGAFDTAGGNLAKVTIGGNLSATQAFSYSALIYATGNIKSVSIGGMVRGGNNTTQAGAVIAGGTLGTVTIAGNDLFGVITAGGKAAKTGKTDLTIGKVSIGGSSLGVSIRAGYDENGAAVNADAQIGSVIFGGEINGANVWAGVQSATTTGKIVDPQNAPGIVSKIASITVRSFMASTSFVAQEIDAFHVGGGSYTLHKGPSNDLFPGIGANVLIEANL